MTSDSRPTTIEELAPLALTFDDVLLQPVESNVIPSQVKTTTRVSRNISIAIPLVSAAMDTVTETRMAVAMAREGGLGILHRNLSIEDQAAMVDQVKRSEAGMIDEPSRSPRMPPWLTPRSFATLTGSPGCPSSTTRKTWSVSSRTVTCALRTIHSVLSARS
ncbi:inosine-5'-monophosphate dehydrogenase [Cutibacterium acnes JCM 18918]|nr:inosine-5'-monophosphate dehydrogenase [Cutibacterium acnes JCM 18918]